MWVFNKPNGISCTSDTSFYPYGSTCTAVWHILYIALVLHVLALELPMMVFGIVCCWPHVISWYMQFILKIGFTLTKKVKYREVDRFQHGLSCKCQQSWLAVEWPWSSPVSIYICIETFPLPLCGHHFWYCSSFRSGGAFMSGGP